ncbi:MAG: DUF4190 domain-containing protein [Polyangiaceae bacterium]|nr:DUF4190 domain-containing protein [Polyangiaceae bacterium]
MQNAIPNNNGYPWPPHQLSGPTLTRPDDIAPGPTPTSTAAIVSLSLGLVGLLCAGPITGIPAVIIGIVALWEIQSSERATDRKIGGTGAAWAGIAIGSIITLGTAALVATVIAAMPDSSASTPDPFPPISTASPTPTAYATPTDPPRPPNRQRQTTTTLVGNVHIVDLGVAETALQIQLRTQRAIAQRDNQTILLQTTSTDCSPCFGLAASLSDPKMQRALEGTRLVRVDVRYYAKELRNLGIDASVIPAFFFLDSDFAPRDGIHGGEWDDDVAENIAPILDAFIRGKLKTRKYPFAPAESPGSDGIPL